MEQSFAPLPLGAYRWELLLASLGVLLLPYLLWHFYPGYVNPLGARIVFSGVPLLIVGGTYLSRWVREHVWLVTCSYAYALTAYVAWVAEINHLDYLTGVSVCVAVVGAGLVLSLHAENARRLAAYLLGLLLVAVFPLSLAAPTATATLAFYCVYLVLLIVVLYLAGVAHLHILEAMQESRDVLAEHEQLLRTVLDAIPDTIFILDREGRLRMINETGAASVRVHNAVEGAGKTSHDLFPPGTAEKLHHADMELMEQGENQYNCEYSFEMPGGQERVISSTRVLLRNEDGEVSGLVGIAHDVTDHKKREQALRQAKEEAEAAARAKSQILNNMSHELRTPLASILGFAEILEEESAGEQAEFAGRIARSGERLRQTLDSVLDLAQIESGSKRLQLRPVDVAGVAREVVAVLHPQAEEKNLTLDLETPGEAAVVAQLDESALHRILSNLVSNAIKFTEEGGVTVAVESPGSGTQEAGTGEVCLRVEDTGIGIDESFQEHLFEDFRQESTGLSRSYEGSGLGLAITERLVEMMNGTISVESTKGEGSCFTVVFPRRPRGKRRGQEQRAASPMPASKAALVQGEGSSAERDRAALKPARKVLVIDDNRDTRRLAEHLLRREYLLVETAGGFDEAVTAAQRHARKGQREPGRPPFDLLLVDIDLGEAGTPDAPRNGLHLLHALRRKAGCAEVPAVALTAYAMPGDRERFLRAGFDGYLAKPFTQDELAGVVGEMAR